MRSILRGMNAMVTNFFLMASLSFCQQGFAGVQLLDEGTSRHVIVLQEEASPSEETAARELRDHFKACTGTELPILSDRPQEDVPMVLLGFGPLSAEWGLKREEMDLGEQGCLLRTKDPHLIIAGTPQAGTLYGVHRFLEEYLGVRWYAPGVTKTPSMRSVSIPHVDKILRPAFLWRHISYTWPGKDEAFLARVGDNSGSGRGDHPWGTQYAFDGRAHSYFRYVNPKEFFEDHPEYFSLIGSKRFKAETQLCLMNPELLEIVTRRMLQRMESQPGVRQHNFSQMDYYNQCQCPACRKMNERLHTAGGTQFWFVNELAERTSKRFPEKLVGTLAYIYTEAPPKEMKMHPNAAVWLCHMFPSCDSHPIVSCPRNADYKNRAERWSRICDHLYIWHYVVDFAHYYNPFPNFRAMAADARFYKDIGVEGLFFQAMGHGGGGGEFSLLRGYYGTQLLLDPDRDAEAILQDFLKGHYGRAWEPIWDYVQLLHNKVEKDNVHMHLYTNPAQGYLTDPVMARAEALFQEAEEKVKEDEELLERVQVARMPLTYARLFPRNGYAIQEDRLVWEGEIASFGELLGFIGRMKEHGFRTVREVSGDPQTLLLMHTIFKSNLQLVVLENASIRVEVVPMLAGRALRMIHKGTGHCVTAHNVKRTLFFPFCGGLEDRVGESFRFYGWVEPATVQERSDRSVILASDTFNQWKLNKTYTIDPEKPLLRVTSAVSHIGTGSQAVRLRSHLEMDLGSLRETRVSFVNREGKTVEPRMDSIIANMREGEHFYREDLPDGEWTFRGSKGVTLIQRFPVEQMDQCWLYAYPEDLGQLELELWMHRTALDPGETLELKQEIELR